MDVTSGPGLHLAEGYTEDQTEGWGEGYTEGWGSDWVRAGGGLASEVGIRGWHQSSGGGLFLGRLPGIFVHQHLGNGDGKAMIASRLEQASEGARSPGPNPALPMTIARTMTLTLILMLTLS